MAVDLGWEEDQEDLDEITGYFSGYAEAMKYEK